MPDRSLFSLFDMIRSVLGRAAPTIGVVDVGAMWLGRDAVAYKGLLVPGGCRVVGFEPVKTECDKLNALGMKDHLYLPHFIGDGSERTFHVGADPMTSSLYEPNMKLLARFQNLADLMRCVERIPVKTTRLDDLPEIRDCDYLKVDVQGAELDVLRGGARTLAKALIVQAEVEFVPLYIGQPLFGDVDRELRAAGFALHAISKAGRAFKPFVPVADPNRPLNQTLWGDAVYVRDFTAFADRAPEELLKIALIMHEVYQSYDLAAYAIQHHDEKTGATLWERYMTTLGRGKMPKKPPLE